NVFQELVVAEKTGYFFDVGNAKSLAQKIIWVQQNYCSAQQVGVAAASYAQQNFSTKKIAEQ
ncbi:MAG: hypothetical protein EAY72_00820, partial [Bacteroidetes bacterium]